MQNYRIEIIGKENISLALDLVNAVFAEFVAVDYGEQGKATFSDYLKVKHDEISKDIESKHKKVWGYFCGDKILGVAAIRNENHIALLFVDKNYHKRGIASTLLEVIRKEVVINYGHDKITVNSSPYAVKAYEKMGFTLTAERQENNGIVYYPMELKL